MINIRQTIQFNEWLRCLKDKQAKRIIAERVRRLASGLAGDVKPIGGGLSELRIDFGPGYRVYYVGRGKTLIVVLCAGAKKSQRADIAKARVLVEQIED